MRLDGRMAVEWSPGHFSVEASTLGLPPGIGVPLVLETDLGNGMPLHFVRAGSQVAYYRQEFGCIEVEVLND